MCRGLDTDLLFRPALLFKAALRVRDRLAGSAVFLANHALQLHGGYGYLSEYGIEKIVRDLRVHQILEGTNEIMRLIVARKLIEGAR